MFPGPIQPFKAFLTGSDAKVKHKGQGHTEIQRFFGKKNGQKTCNQRAYSTLLKNFRQFLTLKTAGTILRVNDI